MHVLNNDPSITTLRAVLEDLQSPDYRYLAEDPQGNASLLSALHATLTRSREGLALLERRVWVERMGPTHEGAIACIAWLSSPLEGQMRAQEYAYIVVDLFAPQSLEDWLEHRKESGQPVGIVGGRPDEADVVDTFFHETIGRVPRPDPKDLPTWLYWYRRGLRCLAPGRRTSVLRETALALLRWQMELMSANSQCDFLRVPGHPDLF